MKIGRTFAELADSASAANPLSIFIDEGQKLYRHGRAGMPADPFWGKVKSLLSDANTASPTGGTAAPLNVFIFAMYGGKRAAGVDGTPANFKTGVRGIDHIRFGRSEFDSLIGDFNTSAVGERLRISSVVSEALWHATNGHPGLTLGTLNRFAISRVTPLATATAAAAGSAGPFAMTAASSGVAALAVTPARDAKSADAKDSKDSKSAPAAKSDGSGSGARSARAWRLITRC
jgi:hypothetical protein